MSKSIGAENGVLKFFKKMRFVKMNCYKKEIQIMAIVVLSAMSCSCFLNAQDAMPLWKAPKKKFILSGWSSPTAKQLKEHIREIEKAPYDGVGIKFAEQGVKDGKTVNCDHYGVFQNRKWEREWFKEFVENLRAVKFEKFTHNFIIVSMHGNIDLFDDEAWKNACGNMALMAGIAKETGLKGLIIDPEAYGGISPFRFIAKNGQKYEAACLKARERGRQFMKAVGSEYPDIVMLWYFWFCTNRPSANAENPVEAASNWVYGLMIPFMNGVYDELLPGAVIVEGNEGNSYTAARWADYTQMRYDQFNWLNKFVASENREKALRQTQLGPAIWLDAYLPLYNSDKSGDSSKYVRNIIEQNPDIPQLELLTRNLTYAFDVSDEYVWCYVNCKWWDLPLNKEWMEDKLKEKYNGKVLFEEIAPGIGEAIEKARDPKKYALKMIENGKWKNLARNPIFEKGSNHSLQIDGTPADNVKSVISEWRMYLVKKINGVELPCGEFKNIRSSGAGYKSDSAAIAGNTVNGCLIQQIMVKKGEKYFIRAYARRHGSGMPSLTVAWQKGGKWVHCEANVSEAFCIDAGNDWKEADMIVTVPQGAEQLAVQLWITSGQDQKDGECRFSNIGIYKMD